MTARKSIYGAAAALCLAFAVAGAPLRAELRGSDIEIAAFIDRHVSEETRRLNIPGAALAVVRDGRVILAKGYGYADLSTRRPLTADKTLVRQASIGKTFIWLLVMQLVERGRVDLDQDVNSYLDFRIPGGITMRHLMAHSSGLAEPLGAGHTRGATLRDDLVANIPNRAYPPGSTIAYSNYGPALAAYIVERLHRRPFKTLVAERIFAPLGMARSSIADPLPEPVRPTLAHSYGASASEPSTFPPMGAATRAVGALKAPAVDMAKFVAMLQSGGGGIVAPATLAEMLRLHRPLGKGLPAGFGLGFIVGHHRGVQHSGHGGGYAGGATDMQLLPDHGLGWAIAFNGRGDNGAAVEARGQLLRAVIDRFAAAGVAPVQAHGASTAGAIAGYYLSTRRAHSGPPRIMDAFLLIRLRAAADGELSVEGEAGETRWLPQGRDRFVERQTGLGLTVTRDPSGKVLRIASPLLNTVAEFEPAPLAVRWAGPLLAATLPILLVSLLWRWRTKRRGGSAAGPQLPHMLRTLAATGPLLIIAVVLGWIAALFSGVAGGILVTALHVLTLIAVLGAVAMAGAALATWPTSDFSLAQSLPPTAAALAALVTSWLFLSFGLAGL